MAAAARELILHRPLTSMYLFALAFAIFMAVSQPAVALTDEQAHVDYVVQLAHGVYPRQATTTIRPETVELIKKTQLFRFDTADPPVVADEPPVALPPSGTTEDARALWVRRNLWHYSYEALQPPLYYASVTPVWMAADAIGGALGGLYALRVVNALLVALLAPLAMVITRELWPRAAAPAIAAGFTVATLPGLVLNGTSVTNDTLAAVLGGLLLLLATRGLRLGWTMRRAALTGLVLGLAILTKPVVAGLLPGVAVALLAPVATRRSVPAVALKVTGMVAVVAGLVVLPWFVVNRVAYGSLSGFAAGRAFIPGHPESAALFGNALGSLANASRTFVQGEPAFLTESRSAIVWVVAIGAGAVGVAGLIRAAVSRGRRRDTFSDLRLRVAGVLLAALTGLIVLGLALPGLSKDTYLTPGRYLYPAVTGVAALVCAGVWVAFRSRLAARAMTAVTTVLAISILFYPSWLAQPQRTGTDGPGASATQSPAAAGQSRSGFSVAVDRIATDRDTTWLHVIASNTSDALVQWNPMPAVFERGHWVGDGDFSASTVFAQTLPAGGSTVGWVMIDRSFSTTSLADVRLVFGDVALSRLTVVDTIAFRLAGGAGT